MADLNALIAQGYQFQAPPDPFVQYGKMQQLENSATQNRLAQQQMQESAQMAPLRVREAQAKLNTADLIYEQTKQAQDVISKVMGVAAEHGGPTDPLEIIKQLSMHSNPLIQAAGKRFADSYQLIQEIEQQQRYDQRAPSPTGFSAPAAASTAAYTPTSAQGTLGGPTPAMSGALGSGAFDVNAPAPVANAFAQTVPSVNAFRPNAVTAESVAAEIKQGNTNFGNAPGWVKDREILMKQYEALLNPRQRTFAPIDASKYTPESIRAFNVSGDQSDLVAKEKSDKAVGNINAADYTPTSVQAFSVSGDYADLMPREKPGAKSDFDKLLDESGLSDLEKQAMRIAKLQKETAKPADRVETRSEFDKLLDASDMTDEQKATARRAKITKETAGPADRVEPKSDFDKLLDESGLSDLEKQAMRIAKLQKETAKPADRVETRSEFEKLLDASNMTEAQKTAARRARITKESTTPADKQEKLKPIPPQINTAIITNQQSIKKIEDALQLLKDYPDGVGLKGNLPQSIVNRADVKGIPVRAAIADIGSLVLHDRSGAAVTASEEPRLLPFIPLPSDPYEGAKIKLQRMLKYAKENQEALKGTYSEDQGYRTNPILTPNTGGGRPVTSWGKAKAE